MTQGRGAEQPPGLSNSPCSSAAYRVSETKSKSAESCAQHIMASKRTHDEAFAGPADDAAPQGRLPRATQEIVTYFEELKSHFDGLDDKEEQSLLVANALEEASGQECAVATDPACSRVLEALLPAAEPQQIAKFFQAVLKGDGLMAMASRYDHLQSVSRSYQDFLNFHPRMFPCFLNLCCTICSPFGAHVLEAVLEQLTNAQQDSVSEGPAIEEVSLSISWLQRTV